MELIATRMKKRSKHLLRGIRDLLADVEFGAMPLTPKALKGEADSERHMYARALGKAAGAGPEPALSVEKRTTLGSRRPPLGAASPWPPASTSLATLVPPGGSVRVSSSYRALRQAQLKEAASVMASAPWTPIAIARTLYAEDTVRTAIVQAAEGTKLCPADADAATCAANARTAVEDAGLPLGWSKARWDYRGLDLLMKFVGLLISIGAAALGAPFWYKLLDRVGSLRNAGNRLPPPLSRPGRSLRLDRRPQRPGCGD